MAGSEIVVLGGTVREWWEEQTYGYSTEIFTSRVTGQDWVPMLNTTLPRQLCALAMTWDNTDVPADLVLTFQLLLTQGSGRGNLRTLIPYFFQQSQQRAPAYNPPGQPTPYLQLQGALASQPQRLVVPVVADSLTVQLKGAFQSLIAPAWFTTVNLAVVPWGAAC